MQSQQNETPVGVVAQQPAPVQPAIPYNPYDKVQWPVIERFVKWDNHPTTKEEWTEERRKRRLFYNSREYRKRFALVEKYHRYMDAAQERRRARLRRLRRQAGLAS